MNSSIQVTKATKTKLKMLKKEKSESYEKVINRLIKEDLLIKEELEKGYKERYKEHKKLNSEWENADSTWR